MLTERELGNYDEIEGARFADALDALDAGREPDLDPREDPELSLLVGLSRAMRGDAEAATAGHAFRSYRHRSRAFVLHSLEREGVVRPTVPEPRVVPLRRRLLALAPVATAAAAALFAVAVLVQGVSDAPEAGGLQAARVDGPADAALGVVPPAGGGSAAGEELGRIRAALDQVDRNVAEGTPVSESVLRQITASTTALAREIEANPDGMDQTTVAEYVLAADTSRETLSRVPVAPGAETALAAAQAAAEDGVVAATRYFQGQDPGDDEAAADGAAATGEPVADGKDTLPAVTPPADGGTDGGTAPATPPAQGAAAPGTKPKPGGP